MKFRNNTGYVLRILNRNLDTYESEGSVLIKESQLRSAINLTKELLMLLSEELEDLRK